MSEHKMRDEFRKMSKWAICKMFEQNPDGKISLGVLHKELSNAWDELCEDGRVIIQDEN